MNAVNTRRLIGGCISVIAAGFCVCAYIVSDIAMRRTNIFSGWGLLAIVVVLASLNARKKLAALPLGRAATWLQVHIYLGLVSVVVFLIHVELSVPNGTLELMVAVLFILVVSTGFAGLALSRVLPPRLSRRGEEVIFERIPGFTSSLRKRAERLVFESIDQGASRTLADFYRKKLARFFDRPRHLVAHLVGSRHSSHALIAELRALDRYLNEPERSIRQELESIIRQKHELDYQYAGQAVLKYWLFAHIPLTYILLLFSLLHVVVVYAFSR